ncbi:hypothetical protein SCA6_008744 [Theobroma cacao]
MDAKLGYHTRSVGLPSISHPAIANVENIFTGSIPEPKARSRLGPWSLVSEAMRPTRIACEGLKGHINEMEEMNYVLIALTTRKLSKQTSVEQLQTLLKQLEALELSILGLEDGLKRMFRQLVKTRVSLLNILSQ